MTNLMIDDYLLATSTITNTIPIVIDPKYYQAVNLPTIVYTNHVYYTDPSIHEKLDTLQSRMNIEVLFLSLLLLGLILHWILDYYVKDDR